MKKVRKDVAHCWAHQTQSEARYGNLWYRDEVIYSYGTHFPIARHYKGCVLFTTRDYSSTTAKHKYEVRHAIPISVPVFYVDNPELKPSKKDLISYKNRIKGLAKEIARGKEGSFRQSRRRADLLDLIQEANLFAETFGFKTRFSAPQDMDKLRAQVKAESARLAKIAKQVQKKLESERVEKLRKWLWI